MVASKSKLKTDSVKAREVIVLSGVRGVGKTLLAKKAQKKIKFEIFPFFDEMAKLAKLRYTTKDQKLIYKRIFENDYFFTKLRRAAIRKIQGMKSKKLVVETRFAIPEKFFLPELTINELMQISPRKIIFIESKREALLKNLAKEFGEENVNELLSREKNYSKFAAEHLKIPLKIIKNEKLNDSVENFVKAIK